MIICIIFGYFANDFLEILSTATIGSFLMFRACGVAFDNYPDYVDLANKIKAEDYDDIPYMFWVYLGLTVVFSILGIIV